jgi:hypothetical protein
MFVYLFIYLLALYFTTTIVALYGWMVVKVNWKGRE